MNFISMIAHDMKSPLVGISGQGWGIEAEEIPYIFDAFYRTESIHNTCGQGLGLAASRALIRQHGGRISIKSKAGKGSIFTVRLPKDKQKQFPDAS